MRKSATRRGAVGALGFALLAATALAFWLGPAASQNRVQANHGLTIGIDTDTAGNSAFALGTVQQCRTVPQFAIIEVDLYVTGVNDLASWEAYIKYDPSVLNISKPGNNSQYNPNSPPVESPPLPQRFMLQTAQPSPPGNNVYNTSETLPNSDDIYRVGAADLVITSSANSDPGTGQHESGVLLRLQVQAVGPIGTFSTLNITPISTPPGLVGPFLKNGEGVNINDTNADGIFDGPISNGLIVVTNACTDQDGDGVPDSTDNCISTYNPDQLNHDTDSMGDACDTDDDNDGLLDTNEPAACQFIQDCDGDLVSDGSINPPGPIIAGPDNCIQVPNANQANADGDAFGDACDSDDDNDTVPDASDNCPLVANGPAQAGVPYVGNQTDTDLDAVGDACDIDDDSDGFSDVIEQHIGTDQLDKCANTATPNDEANDRWGADFDDNKTRNIADMGSFLFPLRPDGTFNKFGHTVPDGADPALVRWDIDLSSPAINIADLNSINPAVNSPTARPPMFGGQPAFAQTCV